MTPPIKTSHAPKSSAPSARRFRPQFFHQVKGQEAITRSLQRAILTGRVPHAYLFSGLRGCGKTTFARLVAKALNCSELSPEGEPCNRCPSCLEMQAGVSLDCIEIDGASHRGIDDVRQIQENVSLRTREGSYKVYIVDEVHMLTKEAFNALLKTLEEPPPQVLFILATTQPQKVPDTVLSRCQCFSLRHMQEQTIVEHLQEVARSLDLAYERESLAVLAQAAQGSMRDSLSLFDQVVAFQGNLAHPDQLFSLLHLPSPTILAQLDQGLQESDYTMPFTLAASICAMGANMEHWLDQLTLHMRHHLVALQIGHPPSNLPTKAQQALYEKKLFSAPLLLELLDILSSARKTLSLQSHLRLHLELTLLALLRCVDAHKGSGYRATRSEGASAPDLQHKKEQAQTAQAPALQHSIPENARAPSPPEAMATTTEVKIAAGSKPLATPQEAKDLAKPLADQEHSSQGEAAKAEPAQVEPAQVKPAKKPVKAKQELKRLEVSKKETPVSNTLDQAKKEPSETMSKARYDTILQFAARELQAKIEPIS